MGDHVCNLAVCQPTRYRGHTHSAFYAVHERESVDRFRAHFQIRHVTYGGGPACLAHLQNPAHGVGHHAGVAAVVIGSPANGGNAVLVPRGSVC